MSIYALALGRAATFSYQRDQLRAPLGMGIFTAAVAKSTVTKAVISAAENSAPAIKGICSRRASKSVKVGNATFASFEQLGDLRIVMRAGERAAFESCYRIADAFHGRGKTIKFDPAFPHRDKSLASRVASEQRVLGIALLKEAPDRRDLCDRGAVVENKRRHLLLHELLL
jgi:hypothetical protein